MSRPLQMTKETLNALKGWPSPSAVDFTAPLDPTITDRVPAGSVVSVSSSTKKFVLGIGNTNRMPLFTFFASDDPVVVNDGGDASTDKGVFIGISPSGNLMALVAVGAYELLSTNYDTDVADGSWLPNDMLSSPTSTSKAGMVTKGTLGTHTICGLVSRGVVDNGFGHKAVAFWPVFLPKYP